jgi:hypothetical protein
MNEAFVHHHWHKYINPINAVQAGLTVQQQMYLEDAVQSMSRRNFLNSEEISKLKMVGTDLVRKGVLTSYGK